MKANKPGQSTLLLLEVIKILEQFEIPYAIIGAFAASFYGVVRASLDADAVIYLNTKNDIELLHSACKKRRWTSEYR